MAHLVSSTMLEGVEWETETVSKLFFSKSSRFVVSRLSSFFLIYLELCLFCKWLQELQEENTREDTNTCNGEERSRSASPCSRKLVGPHWFTPLDELNQWRWRSARSASWWWISAHFWWIHVLFHTSDSFKSANIVILLHSCNLIWFQSRLLSFFGNRSVLWSTNWFLRCILPFFVGTDWIYL